MEWICMSLPQWFTNPVDEVLFCHMRGIREDGSMWWGNGATRDKAIEALDVCLGWENPNEWAKESRG